MTPYLSNQILWIIQQHQQTNHLYDGLPYEFHLKLVVKYFNDYKHLLEFEGDEESFYFDIELACWGHDLIEDTRVTYNDVVKNLGEYPAEIIYTLTTNKGRNRKQRANEEYYHGIRNTSNATFVKLCDRLANVRYSSLFKSHMLDVYRRENNDFQKQVADTQQYMQYKDMFVNLNNLLY